MDIQGLTAVVTGGSSGMGAATVALLKQQGAHVMILDTNIEGAERVAKEYHAHAHLCDVQISAAVEQAFQQIIGMLGVPRICINCAGIAPAQRVVGKAGPMPLADFSHVIGVNLIGTFNVLRIAASHMTELDPVNAEGERGVIINTASIAALEGQVGQAAYSASKAGIVGLTLPLAREFARFGIRVNTIAPGVFQTPMVLNMPQEKQEQITSLIPFPKRLGNPLEFAKLALHMIDNVMFNGAVVRLDGGLRLQ
jgi:NAD(P)-dependent dehydrogenase (short-subunit alcohol dehydrogenase family)